MFLLLLVWCLGSSYHGFVLFVFKVKFCPNDHNFLRAVCVNKMFPHLCQIFFKLCKIFDHSCEISENPFGCAVPLAHSTFQAVSNP